MICNEGKHILQVWAVYAGTSEPQDAISSTANSVESTTQLQGNLIDHSKSCRPQSYYYAYGYIASPQSGSIFHKSHDSCAVCNRHEHSSVVCEYGSKYCAAQTPFIVM